MTLKNFFETFINEEAYVNVFTTDFRSGKRVQLDNDFFMYYEDVNVVSINAKANKLIIEVMASDNTIDEFEI